MNSNFIKILNQAMELYEICQSRINNQQMSALA